MKKFYKLSAMAFLFSLAGIKLASATTTVQDMSLSFGNTSFEYVVDEFNITSLPQLAAQSLFVGSSPIKISTEKKDFACEQFTCYPTNIEGIALRFSIDGQPVSASATQAQSITVSSEQANVQSQLVVYKKLASNLYEISGDNLLSLKTDSQHYALHLNNTQLTIKQKTCRLISAQNQAVRLQSVSQRQLKEAGSLFGGAFDVSLECDAGVKAKVVFRDQNDLNSQKAYLTLTDEASATGVGIELRRDDDSVIQMGKIWDFSHNQKETMEITKRAFSAYYRAIAEPTAGTVKAIATISFSYH